MTESDLKPGFLILECGGSGVNISPHLAADWMASGQPYPCVQVAIDTDRKAQEAFVPWSADDRLVGIPLTPQKVAAVRRYPANYGPWVPAVCRDHGELLKEADAGSRTFRFVTDVAAAVYQKDIVKAIRRAFVRLLKK